VPFFADVTRMVGQSSGIKPAKKKLCRRASVACDAQRLQIQKRLTVHTLCFTVWLRKEPPLNQIWLNDVKHEYARDIVRQKLQNVGR